MRDERQEVFNIVNEFYDRRRFQNADGPEFDGLDDQDDHAPDQVQEAILPNFLQPPPLNMLENNNRMI